MENVGFVAAKDLKAGDEVRLATGGTAEVEASETIALDEPIQVYNFEVEDFHTYYVSGQKVLVHNTCAVTKKNVSQTPRLTHAGTQTGSFSGNKDIKTSRNVIDNLVDGTSMKTNDVLDLASDFFGKGYTEPVHGSGRFVSADGTRVFRMGKNDILGKHGDGPHVNFEILEPNPAKPEKMKVYIFIVCIMGLKPSPFRRNL